jgi:hypothetical protein
MCEASAGRAGFSGTGGKRPPRHDRDAADPRACRADKPVRIGGGDPLKRQAPLRRDLVEGDDIGLRTGDQRQHPVGLGVIETQVQLQKPVARHILSRHIGPGRGRAVPERARERRGYGQTGHDHGADPCGAKAEAKGDQARQTQQPGDMDPQMGEGIECRVEGPSKTDGKRQRQGQHGRDAKARKQAAGAGFRVRRSGHASP